MRGKLVGAAIALAAVGLGAPATRVSADPGGDPNAEACTGQVIALLARGTGVDGTGKINMQDLGFVMIRQACAAGEPVAAIVQKVREAAGSQ